MKVEVRRRLLLLAFQIWDGVVLVTALWLALVLSSQSWDWSRPLALPTWSSIGFVAGMLVFWHWLFDIFGLYKSRRLRPKTKEYRNILKATTLGTPFLALGGVLLRLDFVTTAFIVSFWVFSTSITIVSRASGRYLLGRIRVRGRNLRSIIIVGTGQRAQDFEARIKEQPWIGYLMLGFVDDVPLGPPEDHGREILGDIESLPRLLATHVVDEVFVALPLRSAYDRIQQVISHCEEQGIPVRFLTDFFRLRFARFDVDEINGIPVLAVRSGPEGRWRFVVKRAMDFSIACVLLVALAPLFLVTACFVKLTSPGPIFFRQERIGFNKRRFTLLKFRSMVHDAEALQPELESLNEASGATFKIKNDPRVTRIGRLLRRTSIDELPQLINVLKGDMSLVGPRPLPVRDVERFSIDGQRRRFSVRPGITCLWQVEGRSQVPFDQWMKLDLQYIDNWSVRLDLLILLKTIPAVVRGAGAH